jgi:hypothetical protein
MNTLFKADKAKQMNKVSESQQLIMSIRSSRRPLSRIGIIFLNSHFLIKQEIAYRDSYFVETF